VGHLYDAGVNFFDNAEVYAFGKSEEIMGEALKRLGWRRGSYLVSTKLFWGLHDGPNEKNTLNRKYLIEAIDGSLQRLGLDYVDLLYCHRADPTTPIEETVRAMHNIIERGKALYWGTSEWEAAEILSALEIAERHHLHKPIVEQPVYNLFERHRFAPEYEPSFRARIRACLQSTRLRLDDVESAGLGHADRQIPGGHTQGKSRRTQGL
jgi:aryl-alcohol dehydrogenase-like predicted oxidoreductase